MMEKSEQTQHEWLEKVGIAERMIPLIGNLYRTRNVVTSIYGHRLINLSAIDIIKAHRFARRINDVELSLDATLPILERLQEFDLGTASIDLGELATRFAAQGEDLDTFLATQLLEVIGTGSPDSGADVVLYGFGRIGRLLARIIIAHAGTGRGLRLRAIVVRKGSDNDLEKRASLLRRDSVHGAFAGSISVDQDASTIQANGTVIQVIYSNDPATVDYESYGIRDAIVVDNTGRWRDAEGLSQHLQSPGVRRVLLTAPGKGQLKNIVYGINNAGITDDDRILSAASCTTNAITPVLKVIDERYGVVHGHVETVHSFTNDQNLIDNFHKGDRRGRAAGLNMVITETGAAKAVAKALPHFEGKLTGNAIRVPTPDVSMAVLNLTLERPTTRGEINDFLRQVSLSSVLRQQIDYIESSEVVSTDFVGTTRAGIVDGLATIAEGKNLVLYVWYDNEFGYSTQVVRIIEQLGGVQPPIVPHRKELSQL
ncbi:glyceraldehyde-3-phosphate dehydrogenase [Pseudoclavibacter helvolus]|uniref:glyceraldehyde-3-phosphate dehydrogenase n=1 Tax=Pseudoclavibacter helvolus TaxID=255205 RepID=UPI003C71A0F0